ncbi:unnamed protein product [Adineta ricciae]|uniref:Ubiquitin-like domain-containing protein n=1 Tax=Adineta ricciae TaxID=249248 RepID=A0A814RS27_ADIRI|nr:unnamed protein product [Adineta ricciae]
MATSNDTITLIIRTANNKYADFNLELSLLLTVYDLKQKIALNHPTKPIPKDQRLIFSGKLLDDASLLNQVFLKATTGSSFMVHLVLDSDKNATTPKVRQSSSSVREQPKPSEKTAPPSPSSTYEQYLQELNKYQQQLHQFVSNPSGYTPTSNYQTQAYLQYCYTHYQMHQNLLDYQRTVTPEMTILNQSSPNIGVSPTTSAAAAPPPPPAAAAAAAAAQPAAGNNNEVEQENDLLGVLNMLVELFVLCSIIYFYSTFSRFLLVFVLFTVLYLHCRGYLSIQRRRRVQVQPVPAATPAAPEQAAENDGEDDNEREPATNEAQNQNDIQRQRSSTPTRAPMVDNQVTTSRLLMTAVSSFFSSLIPERPQRA